MFLTGNRILVVEDEALVAIALKQFLDELGYAVIGPFNRIGDAMVALRHNAVDAAVLDVNLGGDPVYPLADILLAEKIPFVFVSGYGSEGIDRRYAAIPLLKKPIERQELRCAFGRPQNAHVDRRDVLAS